MNDNNDISSGNLVSMFLFELFIDHIEAKSNVMQKTITRYAYATNTTFTDTVYVTRANQNLFLN
jgi:adenosylcobinamide amidohydrolase